MSIEEYTEFRVGDVIVCNQPVIIFSYPYDADAWTSIIRTVSIGEGSSITIISMAIISSPTYGIEKEYVYNVLLPDNSIGHFILKFLKQTNLKRIRGDA